jgi:succinyl-CoA synthetase alpha subunit
MSILVNSKTRLLVQGITGNEGTFHTEQMLEYGTPLVAGVHLEKVDRIISAFPFLTL